MKGERHAEETAAKAAGAAASPSQVAPSEAARGAPPRPSYLNLTEENAKAALIEARGDMFVAAQLLGITAIRLERAISAAPLLQATVEELRSRHGRDNWDSRSLDAAIQTRLSVYRVVGLDALHDLATMPIDQNSAQNQVKLAAAARLAGETASGGAGGELAEALRELNSEYQKNAPRLRVVRERTTIETLPPERVVNGEGQTS